MKKRILKILVAAVVAAALLTLAATLLFSHRTNLLLIGLEGTRTDTMIVVSLDPWRNEADLISLPRDTYYPVEGKDARGQKKLNAVYGFKDIGGAEGIRKAAEDILDMEIHHVATVDYDSVIGLVDMLGGVEVEVPFDMDYDDPFANPPLHIHLKAGLQTLDGEDALGFIRFRQSNDGRISDGDIGRIQRQKAFLESAAKKALTWRLPLAASEALSHVETDLPARKAMFLAATMAGMSREDLYFHTLPMASMGRGDDGLYYFFHDEEATRELTTAIESGRRPVEEKESGAESQ